MCLTSGSYSESVKTTSGNKNTANISLYAIAFGAHQGQDCYTLTTVPKMLYSRQLHCWNFRIKISILFF